MLDRPGYYEPPVRQREQQHERVSGRSFQHRGPFTDDATYAAGDIAMISGSAFIALRDNPGSCPGPGWRLLAAVGKRGPKGNPSPTISSWDVDARSFTVTPLMSDGTRGPPLELLGLFREFLQRMQRERAMGDRCEKCEQVAAELRAEFDQLRQDLVSRFEDVTDKAEKAVHETVDEVVAKISVLLTDIGAKNDGLLADVDRRVQRLFDRLSDCLQSPLHRRNEDPPRPH